MKPQRDQGGSQLQVETMRTDPSLDSWGQQQDAHSPSGRLRWFVEDPVQAVA
jgi:hypothetical protein